MSSKKQGKFLRYIKGLIRVLARTRDLYMQSLTATGHVSYGNALGCPTPQITRSRSVGSCNSGFRSAEEQLRDLTRLAGKIEPEQRRTTSGGDVFPSLRRSNTVGFCRIDEDKVFEFRDDGRVGLVYPNSTRVKLMS